MKPSTEVPLVASLLVAASTALGVAADPFHQQLPADRQAVHVLNRLGYGPRPGDVTLVRRAGAEAWIRSQLHPERIAQSRVLDDRLEPLGSLRLPTWEIYERYAGDRTGTMMASGASQLARLLSPDHVEILRSGTADERRAVITGLSPEVRTPVLLALPAKALDGLPDLQAAAFNERVAEQRRLRPPLTDLLTQEQVTLLMRGSDAEKTALIASFDPERRAQVLRQVPPRAMPETFRREAIGLSQPVMLPLVELIDAKVYRALHSTRQLEEVLADFWVNHFNVFSGKGPVRLLLTSYERDAIRPHVLGRFRDMLLATARHPAMLFYLDNWQSQAAGDDSLQAGVNENYGRELLELHTLGVDGGYTQADVIQVARAFTGWTIHEPERYGEFYFDPAMHDRGEKIVLGRRLPRGGGEQDGVRVIEILSRHPSTARFIAQKLARRFVADTPPQALVDRIAATFSETDGDLRAVMETLLLSQEFLSEGAWQAKLKSPFEMVMTSLRALNAEVTDTVPLALRIADLGQPMYGKSEPTGYPDDTAFWASSAGLLGRMNLAAALAAGQVPGVTMDLDGHGSRAAAEAVLGSALSPATLRALDRAGVMQAPEALAAILTASPDFQRR